MPSSYNYKYINAAGTSNAIAGAGSTLGVVNVNTGGTSATLTLYDDVTVVAANKIAVIDASASCTRVFAHRLKRGLTAVLANTADVTITYE